MGTKSVFYFSQQLHDPFAANVHHRGYAPATAAAAVLHPVGGSVLARTRETNEPTAFSEPGRLSFSNSVTRSPTRNAPSVIWFL